MAHLSVEPGQILGRRRVIQDDGAPAGQRRHGDAARLFGAASAAALLFSAHCEPDERVAVDAQVGRARAALGEARYAELQAEGQAMTLEQAIDLAMDDEEC